MGNTRSQKEPASTLQKNWLEWTVFAAGLVLVLGTLGYLAYDALTRGTDTARIEVRLGEPEEVRLGEPKAASTNAMQYFIVPVTVVNQGDNTAEGVLVEVVIEKAGQEVESAEFEVAFVPRRSQAKGQVVFSKDPRTAGVLKPRVLGYEEP